MDDNIINGSLVDIVALKTARARVPNLDGAILGAGDHPLALTVEGDTSYIVRVAIKSHDRVGVA